MKNSVIGILILAVLGMGIWYAFGNSGGGKKNSFGSGVTGAVVQIGDIQKAPVKYLGKEVTVEGQMTRECPSSGCWWYVKDQTGEIRVDSFGSNFSLPLHQEGKHVRSTGKIVKTDGGELQIAASGAEVH
jgi:uncharacterized protein YdeI (BOF family)